MEETLKYFNEKIIKLIQDENHSPDIIQQLQEINGSSILIYKIKICDSTHILAKKLEVDSNNLPLNTFICLVAEEQAKSIGQNDNKYVSFKGNLHLTLIGIAQKAFTLSLLPQTTTLCVYDTLYHYLSELNSNLLSSYTPDFRLKWINDVVHNDRKISGVLNTTSSLENDKIIVVSSIGVNLNSNPTISDCLTASLSNFTKTKIDINRFTELILANYLYRYKELVELRNDSILVNKINDLLLYKNTEVVIYNYKLSSILYKGIFQGINTKGAALIKINESNEVKTVLDGRMRLEDISPLKKVYNKCSCLLNNYDKKSTKFYYFMLISLYTIGAGFFGVGKKIKKFNSTIV